MANEQFRYIKDGGLKYLSLEKCDMKDKNSWKNVIIRVHFSGLTYIFAEFLQKWCIML